MRRIFRFLIPVVVGLGLGLGAIWLLNAFQPARPGTAVVSNGTGSRSLSAPVVPTASPPAPTVVAPPTLLSRPVTPPGIGSEYIALGDSVAYGVGAPVPNDQGFAGLFYNNYLKRVQ